MTKALKNAIIIFVAIGVYACYNSVKTEQADDDMDTTSISADSCLALDSANLAAHDSLVSKHIKNGTGQ